MNKKALFAELELHLQTILESSPTAEDFVETWIKYLSSVGWTEDEYMDEFLRDEGN